MKTYIVIINVNTFNLLHNSVTFWYKFIINSDQNLSVII